MADVLAAAAGDMAAHERAAAYCALVVARGADEVPDLAVCEVAAVEGDSVKGDALDRGAVGVARAVDVFALLEYDLRVAGIA